MSKPSAAAGLSSLSRSQYRSASSHLLPASNPPAPVRAPVSAPAPAHHPTAPRSPSRSPRGVGNNSDRYLVINGHEPGAEASPPRSLNANNGHVQDMSARNPELIHAGAPLFTEPPLQVDGSQSAQFRTVAVEPRPMGPEISEMLEKIVHQVDIITRTCSLMEERLGMVEDYIGVHGAAMSAGGGASAEPPAQNVASAV